MRFQAATAGNASRDGKKFQDGVDPGTGQQVSMVETPDMTEVIQFHGNTLEHVRVPEVPMSKRMQSDAEKNRAMETKYGPGGPGERLTKSIQQEKRDMLQAQQDIDGMPWETRWRRTLIPTHEEIIQDVRDRFELWEVDEIEREKQWYLHWRDRLFKVQRDRLIWPQGYTDYLDHYDENGRRRTLPSDQRWSDVSWKHLADTNYKDRMWLVESEERKALHKMMDEEPLLLEEQAQRQDEMAEIYQGIQYGVIDIDPDQAAQALTGKADPLEVAKTKFLVNEYAAEQAWKMKEEPEHGYDPVSGLPKSDRPPLPTGVTIEQAAAIDAKASMLDDKMQQAGEAALMTGESGAHAYSREQLKMSRKHDDRPGIRAIAERDIKRLREANLELAARAEESSQDAVVGASAPQLEAARPVPGPIPVPKPVTGEVPARPPTEEVQPRQSGYLKVPKRPAAEEPHVPQEVYYTPDTAELQSMPEWYRDGAVEGPPMIHTYGMTDDPVEKTTPKAEYYAKPERSDDRTIVFDDNRMGDNAFDEGKLYRERNMPEISGGEYKPLPTFDETSATERQAAEDVAKVRETDPGDVTPQDAQARSAKLRELRRERHKRSTAYNPDHVLPDLPWEADAVVDPYRGVAAAEDCLTFDKKALERAFRAYKEFMQQKLVEFSNLSTQTSEERAESFIRDAIDKVRQGHVGEYPHVAVEHEDILRTIFEGHMRQFMADYLSFRTGRKPDSDAYKAEADELLRKASGKCKQQGQDFMNFMQEMTTRELDSVRKNPIQRHVILCREKKHEVLAKPFLRWMSEELGEFVSTDFTTFEQLETHRDYAMRHLNEAKYKSPRRLEGVKDGTRDYIVESFYHWCRAALTYHAGRHLYNMYLHRADSRFRGRAEEFFEESYEVFQAYHNTSKEVGVSIPVPYSEPYYEVADGEYLEGESGYFAEMTGDFEKAERIWHNGTTLRWWPQYDETDFLLYYERRGRMQQANEISDRCLESMNKKTHPSIHPFPERAKQWLENAPLTQETAEHLWLRYMGDLHIEHADFCNRNGRGQTAREHFDHGLNFYRIALRQAKERLPPSWIAPTLTRTKLLCRCFNPDTPPGEYLKEVEECIDALRAIETPTPHWIDRVSMLPWTIALLYHAMPAFGIVISQEAQRRASVSYSSHDLMAGIEHRAKTGLSLPGQEAMESAGDDVANEIFRPKILRWRDQEVKESDNWHALNLLYFYIRVRPKTPEEVSALKAQLWPTYEYLYTQTALSVRSRTRLFGDVVRRLCQVMLPGSIDQKKELLKELEKLWEQMRHSLEQRELKRTIKTLEAHLDDPSKPYYVYGTEQVFKASKGIAQRTENPFLKVTHGKEEYERLKIREKAVRSGTPEGREQNSPDDMESNVHDTERPTARKLMD